MTNLVPFNFHNHTVRALQEVGDPWFIAPDVASVLGYAQAKDMTRFLDGDEKGRRILPTLGGPQEITVISESGLYNAIFRSRRPEAREFRRWVTGTVLPELRRSGSFAVATSPKPAKLPSAPLSIGQQLRLVNTVHRVHGKAPAQQMWADLGLPMPEMPEREPDASDDPLFGMVEQLVRYNEVVDSMALARAMFDHDPAATVEEVATRIEDMLEYLGFRGAYSTDYGPEALIYRRKLAS